MTVKLNTAHPDPSSSTGLMLWHVTNSWQRVIREALTPFNLTHVQFVLLAVLTSLESATPTTQKDLAKHAGTDIMMTSQVIRTLEDKGLVTRIPHPTDKRAKILTPTQAGVERVNQAIIAVEKADHAYFSPLGSKVEKFTQSLHLLTVSNTAQSNMDTM